MELVFQLVPIVNWVWREVHILCKGRFSKRVGKQPQLEVVLGPSFSALDREPSYMLNSRLLLLTGKREQTQAPWLRPFGYWWTRSIQSLYGLLYIGLIKGLTSIPSWSTTTLASMPFPSWDRPISIEDVPRVKYRFLYRDMYAHQMKVFHGLKDFMTIFIGKTNYEFQRKEHLA